MRVLVAILGVLFFLIGLAGGLVGAVVIGGTDTDTSWSCTTFVTDPTSGQSAQNCHNDSDSDPAEYARQRDLGTACVIGGAAFFIGGCALLGGAAAGSGRKQQAPYVPPPAYAGAPGPYPGGPSA